MFDLRYHVASLTAVFLALILGILLGVGISSGGFVSKSERSLLNSRITELQDRLDAASRQESELTQQQRAAQTFIGDVYPALMAGRLASSQVALVFVGPVDDRLETAVERVLADAGAPPLVRIRALKVPVDAKRLAAALAGRPALAAYVGPGNLGRLGRALAQEFALGGQTPLWNLLSPQLVTERVGSQQAPATAVVVIRSAAPQRGASAQLLAGFYRGLNSTNAPGVGVEASDTAVSAVPVYARAGLSTVDDADSQAGRLALAILLAGGPGGRYGVKPTAANGLLPPVEPVGAPAVASGG